MSRIDELEKRIAADPNSRMFVQLAEEYRKAGLLEQAIEVCEQGLKKHPQYPSARVALGRALLEAGSLERAGEELEAVLKAVPDNIVANKFLGETYHRLGRLEEALKKYRVAKTLAPEDAELDVKIQEVEREISGGGPPMTAQAPAAPPPPVPAAPEAVAAPSASYEGVERTARMSAPAPPAESEAEPIVEAESLHAGDELAPIPLVEVDEPMILETRDYVPPRPGETYRSPSPPPPPAPPPAAAPEAPPPTFDEVEPEAVYEPEFEMPGPPVATSPAPVAPPAPRAPTPPPAPRAAPPAPPPTPAPSEVSRPKSEMETPTMAEIYAGQGHFNQAIAVYRKILERSPNERRYHDRIEELQMLASASSAPVPPAERAAPPGAAGRSDSRERTIQVLEQWLAEIRKSRGAR